LASNFFLSQVCAQVEAQSLNTASYFGGATLTIYTGTQPANPQTALSGNTALAAFTLPAAGSNAVSNGVITFGTISNVSASATGTATFFRITNGATVVCDGSVGTASADLILNSTAISSGATVSISSFSYTVTQ